jgi:anti-sigma B factor antagonist
MASDLEPPPPQGGAGPRADVLDITVTPVEGAAVVRLAGELDVASAHIVSGYLVNPLTRGSDVVVDMSELRFIDAAGMAALVHARNEALALGRTVRLRHPTPTVLHALELTRLDQAFPIEA